MKVGRYLAVFVLVMGFLIAFGNRGLADNFMMRERLSTLRKANQDTAGKTRNSRRRSCFYRPSRPMSKWWLATNWAW